MLSLSARRPIHLSMFQRTGSIVRRSALGSVFRRGISIQPMTPQENAEELAQQRVHRPNSPHLTIYQPQLTWYLSSAHRITGVALSGTLYLFSTAYLLAPAFGYGFDSNMIAHAVSQVPVWLKVPAKFIVAYPLAFHMFNGFRHLLWDSIHELTLKGVYRTGYSVLALSVLTAAYLALL
ncbi:succinate dehydrogenase cytochrome b subunit [Schizosaccharomyces japonicus yFS275]|uniref:Succinate dehydrogenase cytochrome b subunit n=1 Tax=Schizosaccharomyces japonicus (strain yFS275 / FY16936) TaxID=402676 RepID=B6K5E5_SCHJY|nr:succinate dehydrogenase cytochrome b subunit [Schizosaccharomyces japonicus yFS275]EEB08749.1 succinate dehydrogenase cytochrome b subunit [Schizosaccharomyces japonicus yFS275]